MTAMDLPADRPSAPTMAVYGLAAVFLHVVPAIVLSRGHLSAGRVPRGLVPVRARLGLQPGPRGEWCVDGRRLIIGTLIPGALLVLVGVVFLGQGNPSAAPKYANTVKQ